MSRLQLALNVDDLESAIAHYSKIFGVGPAKVRPGYANFAISNPPLKLVLLENPDADDSINHLGVEVESVDEVRAEHARVTEAGVSVHVEGETVCCYAVQDKFWIQGGQHPFEVYTVLADAETMARDSSVSASAHESSAQATVSEVCCAPAPQEIALTRRSAPSCC
ncbi:MAG: ArsI/CadI family heavy metal resistance metalloenzyme [Actinomycetota bacterium]